MNMAFPLFAFLSLEGESFDSLVKLSLSCGPIIHVFLCQISDTKGPFNLLNLSGGSISWHAVWCQISDAEILVQIVPLR
jgi:hypothetical protein